MLFIHMKLILFHMKLIYKNILPCPVHFPPHSELLVLFFEILFLILVHAVVPPVVEFLIAIMTIRRFVALSTAVSAHVWLPIPMK